MNDQLIKTINKAEVTFFNKYHRKIFDDVAFVRATEKLSKLYFTDNRIFIIDVKNVYQFVKDLNEEADKMLELLLTIKIEGNTPKVQTENWSISFTDMTIRENGG